MRLLIGLMAGYFMIFSGKLSGQEKRQLIRSYFDSIKIHDLYNGNVLLAENNHPLIIYSGGDADQRLNKRNHALSRFNLASISKIFTSTAILQLREKGKLKLEDDYNRYFPEFPFKGITIQHLLTHTSGLPNLELTEAVIKKNPDTVITNAILMTMLQEWPKPLYFKPGNEFRYCNTNYMLLALLVEKLSGLPFAKYLDKYIFKPAGMSNSYLAVYGTRSWSDTARVIHQVLPAFFDSVYIPSNEVKRYRFSEYNNEAAYGSGNVISTVEDMLKFDAAFFAGKLLKQTSIDLALTPLRLNNGQVYEDHMDTMWGEGKGYYGLGWEIFEQPGYGKAVGHGGFKFGIATFYYRSLERKQTIIAYTNGVSNFGAVVTSAFYLLNNKPAIPVYTKKSVVRTYAKALIAGGPDHAVSMFHLYRSDTAHYYFSVEEMNFLGYDFLYQATFNGHQQMSLETFKLNTFLDPADYNVYDSYGEALMESGNRQDAIIMYRWSLKLNPGNEGGIKALKKLNAL